MYESIRYTVKYVTDFGVIGTHVVCVLRTLLQQHHRGCALIRYFGY